MNVFRKCFEQNHFDVMIGFTKNRLTAENSEPVRYPEENSMTDVLDTVLETRSERRKKWNRDALIKAACSVVSRKGIDAATVHDLKEEEDVGLAQHIRVVTNTFEDPAPPKLSHSTQGP